MDRFDPLQDGPPDGLVVEPATVHVTAPQEVFDSHHWIATVPSLPPTRSGEARVALVQELDGFPIKCDPPKVTVKAPAQTHEKRVLRNVPIHFLCPPGFTLRPEFFSDRDSRASLTVMGPKIGDDPKVFAFIDLTHGHFESGSNHEQLQIQFPNRDFCLADDQPRIDDVQHF